MTHQTAHIFEHPLASLTTSPQPQRQTSSVLRDNSMASNHPAIDRRVDLADMLSSAIELLRGEADACGVRFRGYSVERTLFHVDETELLETIESILRRVLRASVHGSLIEVEAFSRRGEIELCISYRFPVHGRRLSDTQFDTINEHWSWKPALPATGRH